MMSYSSRVFYKVRNMLYAIKETNKIHKQGDGKTFSQVTYYVAGNAGDTTLSQCVRRTFESSFKNIEWNLIPIVKPVTQNMIDKINKTDALVIGGGGLFLPDTNKNNISGWQWAIYKEQLMMIKKPIIVYSVGYNYFKGQLPTELFIKNVIALCEKADFIGLRNMGSVGAIKEILPEELRKKVVYQPCTTTLIRKLYKDSIAPKVKSKKIAINMAFDRSERRYGRRKKEILTDVAQFCKCLQKKEYQIVLVYHMDTDKEFKSYLDGQQVTYIEVNLTNALPEKVIRFYNGIEMVIGMRGHAQMIPFGINCEIISLGTHDKMRWFLEDIGAEDWYVDLNQEDTNIKDKLISVFENIHEKNNESTNERLIQAQNRLWSITNDNMVCIQKLLGGGYEFLLTFNDLIRFCLEHTDYSKKGELYVA